MADIDVHILAIGRTDVPSVVRISGVAFVSPGYEYQWEVAVPSSTGQLAKNSACINAAIAAAEAGRQGVTIGSGNKTLVGGPEDLTSAQATAKLDIVTPSTRGLVPASGGGTTSFLRADGIWTTPAGGGGSAITRLDKGSTQSSTSATFADETDLGFAIAAGEKVMFHYVLRYSTAVTTTALQVALNGPAGASVIRYSVDTCTSATARHNATQTAYDTNTNPATSGAATILAVYIDGIIVNGSTAGTITLRFRSEVGGSSVSINDGSIVEVFRA